MNAASTIEHPPETKTEFLLAALRRACAHLRATASQLDEIGVSLKLHMITAEDAVAWLDHLGAVDLINVEPWPTRIEVTSA